MKTRFFQIDLLRFSAALSVLLFHYTFRGFAADNMSPLYFPYLKDFFKYGYLGVDLFFIISGFVILLSAERGGPLKFIISRITRLYPAFIAGVTFTAAISIFIGSEMYRVELRQYLLNLSMVSGFFGIKYVDGVYWSLLVELKFYFLIFLIVLFKRLKDINIFLYIWLLASIFASFIKIPYATSFFIFPMWSSYFIAGSFFYLIKRDKTSLVRIIGILLAYLLSIKISFITTKEMITYYNDEFSEIIVVVLISFFYILFFLLSTGRLTKLNYNGFTYVGPLTYPLYLIHQNVGFMIFGKLHPFLDKYLILGIATLLVIIISYLIHKFIEKPVATILKKLLNTLLIRE